jgi:soluble lytic murein transglycosylase-like protein
VKSHGPPATIPCVGLKSRDALPIIRSDVLSLRFAATVLVLAAAAPAAEAQIYTWRDDNGTLVLSDKTPTAAASDVRTFKVPHSTEPVLVTKPTSRNYSDNYDALIVQHAQAQNLRPDLVRAVVQVESGYNPRAVSSKGAMGLMQLMPATARQLGVRTPFDPEENIRGGTTYLRQLLERFDGNEELALAAYNAGPVAVDRYGNQIPPYRETRDYVRKVRTQTTVGTSVAVRKLYYKTIEIIDGRQVVRYSDTPPTSGPYEIIDPTR